MRHYLPILTVVLPVVVAAACENGASSGPVAVREPPVLRVTSPTRSLTQSQAGILTVTGQATTNSLGDAIDRVLVNNVQATLGPDGSFTAQVALGEGATLIETVVHDLAGSTVSDTRAVQSGQLLPVGADIDRAVGAGISTESFSKISAVAGPVIKGVDINALIKPLQPMVNVGNPANCAYGKVYVDHVEYADIKVNVVPVADGLRFDSVITGLDARSHVDYGIPVPSCTQNTAQVTTTATTITASGTLGVTAVGAAGFAVSVVNPNIVISGMHVASDTLPGSLENNTYIQQMVQTVTAKIAELAIGPVFNKVAGTLTGPLELRVLGQKVTIQVVPVSTAFATTGGVFGLNMKLLIDGSEKSPGFIFTKNQPPSLDATRGLQIALADDLINEVLAEVHALGLLDLSLPEDSTAFDTAQVKLSMPPMVSADGRNGALRLVLGDMVATFTNHGTPVARAAINVRINVNIGPSATGVGLGIQLAEPEIHVDTLDDIPNLTGLSNGDFETAIGAVLGAQIESLGTLLGAIPMPAGIGGLTFGTMAMASNDSYVVVTTSLK